MHLRLLAFRCSLFLIVGWLTISAAFAEEAKVNDDTFTMEAVVVEDAKRPESASETTIEKEVIERERGKSASKLLMRQTAISVSESDRGEASVSLRGFDQRQILILLDEVPLLSAYDAKFDVGKFPAMLLGAIRIQTPTDMQAPFGNGLGGRILLESAETRGRAKAALNVEAAYPFAHIERVMLKDEQGSLSYLLSFGHKKDYGRPMSARFTPAKNENGHIRHNSDRQDVNAAAKLKWQKDAHSLTALAMAIYGEYGTPPDVYSFSPRYWRWKPWATYAGYLAHEFKKGARFKIRETLFASFNTNTLQSYDDKSYTTQATRSGNESRYDELQLGVSVLSEQKLPIEKGRSLLWAESLMLRFLSHASHWTGEADEPAMTAMRADGKLRQRFAIKRNFAFETGLCYEGAFPLQTPEVGDEKAMQLVSPFAKFEARPISTLLIELAVSGRGRFPTFKERYSGTLDSRIPNPNLSAERAWHFAADISWRPHRTIALKLSGFDAEVFGLIEEKMLGEGKFTIENVGRARLAGAEAGIAYEPIKPVELSFNYAYLHAVKPEAKAGERKLLGKPEHKVFFEGVFHPFAWWELSTTLRLVGEQRYQNETTARFGTLGMYAVWNGRTAFRFLKTAQFEAQLWMRVDNLLDMNYQSRYGMPGEGRRFWMGLDFNLFKKPD